MINPAPTRKLHPAPPLAAWLSGSPSSMPWPLVLLVRSPVDQPARWARLGEICADIARLRP